MGCVSSRPDRRVARRGRELTSGVRTRASRRSSSSSLVQHRVDGSSADVLHEHSNDLVYTGRGGVQRGLVAELMSNLADLVGLRTVLLDESAGNDGELLERASSVRSSTFVKWIS